MADTRVKDIANELMVSIANGLEDEGVSVPTRRYIHSGDVAADFGEGNDCAEAFVVAWQASFQGQPGERLVASAIKCAVPLSAGYTIFLLRCVPGLTNLGRAPSSAELQKSGEEILTDAMTLPRVIVDKQLQDDLIEAIPGCSLVGIGNVVAFGPLGGVGGCSVDVVVGLV